MLFLSYCLSPSTPTYGARSSFVLKKSSAIQKGDIANDSHIETTAHIGTHIDMPYHFYEDGQTVKDFSADFWFFTNPLVVEINPQGAVIHDELIHALGSVEKKDYDILIVKTGICHSRGEEIFWQTNYGFHPDLYDYLMSNFGSLRVFGFDSISVSSFAQRDIGREAHRRFLNPKKPLLLLEDMDLTRIDSSTRLKSVIISPLRIENCDGLPCTVFGELCD